MCESQGGNPIGKVFKSRFGYRIMSELLVICRAKSVIREHLYIADCKPCGGTCRNDRGKELLLDNQSINCVLNRGAIIF